MYVGKGDAEELRRRGACSVAHAFKRARGRDDRAVSEGQVELRHRLEVDVRS